MPSIQVKDIPDDVHATLRRRAREAGMSFQEYVLAGLSREARTPTLDEVLDRVNSRSGGRAPQHMVVEILRAERDAR
jgi:hypothetical protein